MVILNSVFLTPVQYRDAKIQLLSLAALFILSFFSISTPYFELHIQAQDSESFGNTCLHKNGSEKKVYFI